MALTKTRRVLDHIAGPTAENGYVEFASYEDDEQRLHCGTTITEGNWREMGEPEQVTVTIEPGDLLNSEPTVA